MGQALGAVLRILIKKTFWSGSVQCSLEEEKPIIPVLNPEGSVAHTVKAHLGNFG